jgi:hypothetical protein
MIKDVQGAIATWKQADAEARAAAALLARAYHEYESKQAPAISDILLQEAAKARARANEKLSLALEMIRLKSLSSA